MFIAFFNDGAAQVAENIATSPIDLTSAIWAGLGLPGAMMVAAIIWLHKLNLKKDGIIESKDKKIDTLTESYQTKIDNKDKLHKDEISKYLEKMTELIAEANQDRKENRQALKELTEVLKQSNALFGANQEILKNFHDKNEKEIIKNTATLQIIQKELNQKRD